MAHKGERRLMNDKTFFLFILYAQPLEVQWKIDFNTKILTLIQFSGS